MGPIWWDAPSEHNAFQLSVVSVAVTFFAGVYGIVGYVTRRSSLLLCYGLENFVDTVSSLVVLWRFFCPGDADEMLIRKLEKREKKASVAISFLLVILGIGIIAAAMEEFKLGAKHKEPTSLIIGISFISIMVFGSFTIVKLHYATRLNSAALHKDGFCSFIGTALSFSLFMDTLLAMWDPSTWWLEPLISTVVGALSFGVGVSSLGRNIFVQHIPIYTLSWWTSPPPTTTVAGDGSSGAVEDPGAANEAEMTTVGGADPGDKEII